MDVYKPGHGTGCTQDHVQGCHKCTEVERSGNPGGLMWQLCTC